MTFIYILKGRLHHLVKKSSKDLELCLIGEVMDTASIFEKAIQYFDFKGP